MPVSQEALNVQYDYATEVRKLLQDRLGGRTPKALTHTYGCQGNVADGERINGLLEQMGYEFTDDPAEADFILFNTCAVREHAEERVFGNVGRLKQYKTGNPDLIICLCGCMVQQPHILERIKNHFHYVDLAFGTHVIYKLPELLYRCLTGGGRVFDISDDDNDIAEDGVIRHNSDLKAFLPVTYGCNNFCTYCVVPHVRGRERSRSYDEVLKDARSLVDQGYKEIMLLGQNVNSYGNDFHEKNLFPKLLREINDIPGDFRIRFMTSHPKDCSTDLLDAMAACDKVERHLHLPVQSGNDRVLKAMNRRYTREHYLSLVSYARSVMPDLCLTSDIIVGFPGETHEEFLDTLSLVQEVGYSALYTFLYSPRVGTPAARMEDPYTRTEKQQWFEELQFAQEQVATERSRALQGKTFRVLVEHRNKRGRLEGRNSGNTMIEFDGPDSLIGNFCLVRVTESLAFILKGELAEDA
ncbi:MAG: tRNA (N6-isopentenyl adenosine(37)-C2)-methylthiotransferase MiaB [Clostridia bacterium]|nr:tRNA (N6-isopentenyl adenosine(37)-C2)-methylthiotransferase MiaB [Clostridia bacterium]